jgi:carbonic anhydrase
LDQNWLSGIKIFNKNTKDQEYYRIVHDYTVSDIIALDEKNLRIYYSLYMRVLKHLFEKNRKWADNIKKSDPDFFTRLAKQQTPEYLWIGCSDSRVPAIEIVDMLPGEIFVHRNIANLVIHTDMNCLSVIQYAVYVLEVKHIIVCGHYGCGGVQAALENNEFGLIDNWLLNIKNTYHMHQSTIDNLQNHKDKVNLLCELNVIEQVKNVCHTTIVQRAWKTGQDLTVHGWIYNIKDGLLKDLDVCVTNLDELSRIQSFKEE